MRKPRARVALRRAMRRMTFRLGRQDIWPALAGLTAVLTMSCGRDPITTPQTRGFRAPISARRDAAESPPTASATLSDTSTDVMPADRAKIASYVNKTIVEAQVAQSITISPLVAGLSGGFLALGGRGPGSACTGNAAVSSGDLSNFSGCSLWSVGEGGATSWTDTIEVYQDAYVSHSADSPGTGACSSNCFAYSGTTSATLTRLDADFAISAGASAGTFFDSATVNSGEMVVFKMNATPNQIGSFFVSTAADSSQWSFVADDGQVLTGCPSYYQPLGGCGRVITKSGTMHVTGFVNGALKAETRAIHVTVPRIAVTCTPSTIVRASSSPVSCAASAAGTVAIKGWTFTATDSAIGSVTSSQTTTTWAGTAVASGVVTVQATVNGFTATSDTGHIVVTPRSGWSWANDKSTGDATTGTFECNNARHYVVPGWFGWTTSDSTCKNIGLLLWPDPTGKSSKRGWQLGQVTTGGPNGGLWYVTSDKTGMHIRSQILKDIRPDGLTYSVTGSDTVAARCKSAGVKSSATVTVVNNTCMKDTSTFNFAGLYSFSWKHEHCHETQFLNAFPTITDPRTKLETVVRPDTVSLNQEAVAGQDGFTMAAQVLQDANTIDTPNPQSYTFWSRNTANSAWILRTYQPAGILAPECQQ